MSNNMVSGGPGGLNAVRDKLVSYRHKLVMPTLEEESSLLDTRQPGASRFGRALFLKRKRQISIRASLFWLVTACLLPAILISGWLLWRDYEQGQAELVNASLATARTLSAKIDREFEAVESSLVALATSPSVGSRNLAAFHAQAKEVADLRAIESIALFDASGYQLMHTATPYGTALPLAVNMAQLKRVLNTGKPETSNLFMGPVHKKLLIHVAIPVRSDFGIPHVLVGVLLPDRFHKALAEFPLPPGFIASAFDGSGAIAGVVGVAGNTEQYIGRQVNPGLAGALQKTDEGALNTINLQGVEILSTFSRSATSRWGVAIGIPRSKLLTALERSLWLLVGASLLILGSGITFAWILGGRIAATIRALRLPAMELGQGKPVVVPVLLIQEADEVGQSLVRASNTLADAIAALKSNEARLRGIVGSALDAIITVDDGQNIVLFNAAAATMFACPVERAIGMPLTRFIPEHFRARHADFLEKQQHTDLQANSGGLAGISTCLQFGGQEFPAEISFSSAGDSGVWLHTLIIRDVSSRVKAYKALVRSNLDLQQFAYVASHDLKTPLRAIAGFVQLLEKNHGERLDVKARDLIRRTADATMRLEQLTEDLLSFARIESRAKQFEAVNMTEIAHEVTHLHDAAITSAQAVVRVNDLPVVLGDRTQLAQLLLNLVGNALKYCRDRAPVVEVSALQNEGMWVFSVADNGIGIEAQHFEKVFEIFKRLHTKSEFAGTGIGLAVCRRVVEGHGGKIWVTSVPGQGSVFRFTLPAKPLEASQES